MKKPQTEISMYYVQVSVSVNVLKSDRCQIFTGTFLFFCECIDSQRLSKYLWLLLLQSLSNIFCNMIRNVRKITWWTGEVENEILKSRPLVLCTVINCILFACIVLFMSCLSLCFSPLICPVCSLPSLPWWL